jgi:pyruvate dehydrogenase E1 component beta subunit
MVAARLFRPASRLLSSPSGTASIRSACSHPSHSLPAIANRRTYATPSGVKDVAVRDALNEALAEELATDDRVFVLGEEVAQYNGA